jgi:hypothetical protein
MKRSHKNHWDLREYGRVVRRRVDRRRVDRGSVDRGRLARRDSGVSSASITIRPAYADDQLALGRLAALDSAEIPSGPLLLAEVDGSLRAALSLADDGAIADPFFPTLHLLELLRAHAAVTATPARARRGYRLRFA